MEATSAKFGKRGSIDPGAARKVLDPGNFLAAIATDGGSNPRFMAAEAKARRKELEETEAELSGLRSSLKGSERKLNADATGMAREVKTKS